MNSELTLNFKHYPKDIPQDGDEIFFISSGFYDIHQGFAKSEITWDNGEGGQIIFTGKETKKQIKDLEQDGYEAIAYFSPEEGSGTPSGSFIWCLAKELGDLYCKANPGEYEEKP